MLFLIFQSCHIILSSFQLPPHLPPDLFISLYFCIFLYISILSYSSFPADVAPLSPSPRPYFFIYFIFFYIFFIFFNIIYIFFIFLFFIFFIFQINLVIFPLSSSPLTFPQTLFFLYFLYFLYIFYIFLIFFIFFSFFYSLYSLYFKSILSYSPFLAPLSPSPRPYLPTNGLGLWLQETEHQISPNNHSVKQP